VRLSNHRVHRTFTISITRSRSTVLEQEL
jgi:hypothetical protein